MWTPESPIHFSSYGVQMLCKRNSKRTWSCCDLCCKVWEVNFSQAVEIDMKQEKRKKIKIRNSLWKKKREKKKKRWTKHINSLKLIIVNYLTKWVRFLVRSMWRFEAIGSRSTSCPCILSNINYQKKVFTLDFQWRDLLKNKIIALTRITHVPHKIKVKIFFSSFKYRPSSLFIL